jgi:hypothetical protein
MSRNASFFTADRSTHLKIVAVSLLASIAVLVVGIAARPPVSDSARAIVFKPQPVIATEVAPMTAVR